MNEIVLTPNYAHLFATMLREARTQSEARRMFDFRPHIAAEALRAVQRFLAPLNIAAQSMTDRDAVEKFREALNEMVQDIDRTAAQLEAGTEP